MPSVPAAPQWLPRMPPRPADVPPRPAPSATAWLTASGTLISSHQQACQEVSQSARRVKPRLCERGMDTYYSCGKCGHSSLPNTRAVCVAVHRSPYGSLGTMLWGVSRAVGNRPNVEPPVPRDRNPSYLSIPGLGRRGTGCRPPQGTCGRAENPNPLEEDQDGKGVNTFFSLSFTF